eukprot:TRINITY_DN112894_c0_g1_i1.p1 TRINITY_DN112894_c0_g1~~TRINITY_DN112894_c0_g1_i1.p1  ORF type:complete len:199 (-),score=43.70 TRINITY_DN112894_c0_g1_i1:10-606(-)
MPSSLWTVQDIYHGGSRLRNTAFTAADMAGSEPMMLAPGQSGRVFRPRYRALTSELEHSSISLPASRMEKLSSFLISKETSKLSAAAASSFLGEAHDSKAELADLQSAAARANSKAAMAEEASVWGKSEADRADVITLRSARLAYAAVMVSFVALSCDLAASYYSVRAVKRQLEDAEDELAQVAPEFRDPQTPRAGSC